MESVPVAVRAPPVQGLARPDGQTQFCFPSNATPGEAPTQHVCVKSVSKQVGDGQARFKKRKPLKNRKHDDSLVLANGKNGEWTPHDLRRTGATMMQQLGVSPDVIDRCQNHVLAGSRIRRAYIHYDYAKEKREAWARLGQRIDTLLDNANVIHSTSLQHHRPVSIEIGLTFAGGTGSV